MICPDPYGHLRLWTQREVTWRLTPAQRAAEMAHGCPWCACPLARPIPAASPLLLSRVRSY